LRLTQTAGSSTARVTSKEKRCKSAN
jgi:hypothetical protein